MGLTLPPCAPQEQASWVCRCEAGVVQRLEQDFKATLQQHNSLEQWALWLDAVVGRVLKPHLGTPAFPRAAKLFLLKWSFYRCDRAAHNALRCPQCTALPTMHCVHPQCIALPTMHCAAHNALRCPPCTALPTMPCAHPRCPALPTMHCAAHHALH